MSNSVVLPPNLLRSGDTITIKTTLTINDPRDEVWPIIENMQLESVEVERIEQPQKGDHGDIG
jgi:hypothetical protein